MTEKQEAKTPYKPMAYEETIVFGILCDVYGVSKEEAMLMVQRHRANQWNQQRTLEKILRAWA